MATYESKKYAAIPVAATQIADGSVSNSEYQFINSLSSNAQTQITALDTAKLNLAGGTLTGNLTLADNVHAYFGAGQDIDILSDGTVGYIKANDLRLQSSTGENYVTAAVNGAANLWYDNANKLQTTASGIGVTGEVSATGNIVGNGQHLTNLNGSNISSGTVADARISTLTASKLTGALPAIDGSNLTGIDSVPSSSTAVGAIKYFALYYDGSGTDSNTSIGVGTEVVPSTYSSSNKYLSSSVEYINSASSSGPQDTSSLGYLVPGFVGTSGGISGKSRASESGTWRCISSPIYNKFTTAGGSGGTYTISGGGLFQRIS